MDMQFQTSFKSADGPEKPGMLQIHGSQKKSEMTEWLTWTEGNTCLGSNNTLFYVYVCITLLLVWTLDNPVLETVVIYSNWLLCQM